MLCLLLLLSLREVPKHQDIAVGVWAGKETLSKRVLAQAKTWMRYWDKVHVFTDEVLNDDCDILNREAYPCNVTCVALGNLAEHLEGTEWTHRWYFAQPRFLPSMASLWELNRDAKWFLFGDDDTYIFRPAVERKAKSLDPSQSTVIGKFWSSWERVTQDVPPLRDVHPFAQGGAGVLISSKMMDRLGPNLRNCSLSFNDPDFAGSMRFAMCAERVVGQNEWSADKGIVSWSDGFHSSPPEYEIGDRQIVEAPATFHQIKPDMFPKVWKAHALQYTLKNGTKVNVDLGLYSFTRAKIPLGHISNKFEWRFGYWIALEDSKVPLVRAKDSWHPILGHKEKLIGFAQMYEKGVEVLCYCSKSVKTEEVQFVRFADELGAKPIVQLSCANLTYKTY